MRRVAEKPKSSWPQDCDRSQGAGESDIGFENRLIRWSRSSVRGVFLIVGARAVGTSPADR